MQPDYLSVSQVTTYLGCPRRYKFRYVDKLIQERRSADLALGSAVHSAIEWWQVERIAKRPAPLEQALRIFRSDWTSQTATGELTFDLDETADDLRVLGEKLVTLFAEKFANDVPEAVELRFEVPLRDPGTGETLPVPLVGFLDFAVENVVGEMKTCARKNPASTWMLQLSAYSYAWREQTGVRPRMRVVELIKTKVPKIEIEELTLTARDEAWFVEIAGEVLNSLAVNAFHPNPSWQCPTCEYRRACRGG